MAAAQSSGYAEDGVVEFIIKNPAGPNSPAFTLRASLSSTVLDLKKQLQKEYQGKPHPAAQTKVEASVAHCLHLVIKEVSAPSQAAPQTHVHPRNSAAPSGYTTPSFNPRPAPQVQQGAQAQGPQAHSAQPQNAAMLAAYQAALNSLVNNRQAQPGAAQAQQQAGSPAQSGAQTAQNQQSQPTQEAQPAHSTAPAQAQAPLYAIQPPPMLAYMPVLIPSPYAAVQQGWPQQQPQQQGAAMPGQPPLQYPYPHFMPVLLPYGMPPAVQGMPPGAFRVQVAHPAAAQGPPYAGWAAGLQQRHGGQVPGGAAPGAAPGMANGMPANLFRMRRGPGMQVRMVRIDLKALVQMAVVALVLYQHCPPGRFLMLMGGGAILYFTGMGPIQRALQRLVALALPTPVRAGAAGQADAAGQAAPPPQWSLLGELQAIIVGFFSSLIPGWNMNAEDAAAFAAAQQMQAAQAAREQQRAAGAQNNLHHD